MSKYVYATNCIESDGPSIIRMRDQAFQVTFATFSRRVDWQPWARNIGYVTGRGAIGLHLKNDYYVTYHRSRYRGWRCYYAIWSGIEYIFLSNATGE